MPTRSIGRSARSSSPTSPTTHTIATCRKRRGPLKPQKPLSAWFRQTRPAFGCFVYGVDPETEKFEQKPAPRRTASRPLVGSRNSCTSPNTPSRRRLRADVRRRHLQHDDLVGQAIRSEVRQAPQERRAAELRDLRQCRRQQGQRAARDRDQVPQGPFHARATSSSAFRSGFGTSRTPTRNGHATTKRTCSAFSPTSSSMRHSGWNWHSRR